MRARAVLGAVLVGSASLVGAATTPVAVEAAPPAKPSIVLILSDDQRWDTLGAMPTVQSQLAGRGVTLTNGFVTTALCCPSRASILSGQYAHSTGVFRNNAPHGGFKSFRDSATIATALKSAGYRTGFVGKYLRGYGEKDFGYVPPGWDRWVARGTVAYFDYSLSVDASPTSFGNGERDYSTDVLANFANGFIRNTDRSKPLFLVFAPFAPHGPAVPAARHDGAFRGLDPWRPSSYNEKDVSDKPPYVQHTERLKAEARRRLDRFRRGQYEMLLSLDEAVGRILDALADTGRLGRSLVVYTSDNGFLWGEHRLTNKSVPYEESIRVPMIARYDPAIPAGSTNGTFALNIDLAPTFADVAHVELPRADGQSLLPVIEGNRAGRRNFLVERLGDGSKVPSYCAVRTSRWMYVDYPKRSAELYDLARDPYELHNYAGRDSLAKVQRRLRERLAELCDPPPPGFRLGAG